MTISRETLATIVSARWQKGATLENDHIYWYLVKTSETGEHEFSILGVIDHGRGPRDNWAEKKFAVGNVIRVGDLHKIPLTKHAVWANLEPGVNVHIGVIDDGLLSVCPEIGFICFEEYGAKEVNPVPAHLMPLCEAAFAHVRQGRTKIAAKILGESGWFKSVHIGPLDVGSPYTSRFSFEIA